VRERIEALVALVAGSVASSAALIDFGLGETVRNREAATTGRRLGSDYTKPIRTGGDP
jgi:hypothetical protein